MNLKPETIEAIFKKQFKPQSPGAVLAIVHQGQLVYKKAWGAASVENPAVLTPQSVFNTGSLAKQFTAFAIFKLQHLRKLSLEDEVRKTIPELPSYGAPMRLRHLLWHTSGLKCFTTLLWWGGVAQRDNYSRKQSLELVFRQKELNFLPGTEYLYGNSNYLLLSEIVQRVSGRSLADFCKEHVFSPLGMNATHFRDKPSLPIPNLVSGHFEWGQGGLLVNRSLGAVAGVGRLMSHAEDLARWEKAFYRTPKAMLPVLRPMLAQGWLDSGQKIRYGGGLMFQRYRGLAMVRHDGYTSGCRAEFCRFPEKETAIICLVNHSAVSPTGLARQVADCLWGRELEPVSALGPGQPPAPPARAKLPLKRLRELEGLYRSAPDGPFAELQLRGGALHFISMHAQIALAPESGMALQGLGPGRICRFDLDAGGGFIMTKQGRATRFERVKLQPKGAAAKLERYVGRYASPELLSRIEVTLRDGALVLNDPNGVEWELKQLRGGHFYNYFRDIYFSKRGMVMEGADHWVRKLKWVRL